MVQTRAQARAAGMRPLKLADVLLRGSPRTSSRKSAAVPPPARAGRSSLSNPNPNPRVRANPNQSPKKRVARKVVVLMPPLPSNAGDYIDLVFPPSANADATIPSPSTSTPRPRITKRSPTPNVFDFNRPLIPGWTQHGTTRRLLMPGAIATPEMIAEYEELLNAKKGQVFDEHYDRMLVERESRVAWYEKMVEQGLKNAEMIVTDREDTPMFESDGTEMEAEEGDADMAGPSDAGTGYTLSSVEASELSIGAHAHGAHPLVPQPTMDYIELPQKQFQPLPFGVPVTTMLRPYPTEML